MQASYTKNYLRIYTTQFLAILINVLSLVIVIPFISENAEVYGIYTICISFIIFFSYSDLGFLNAGYKYASEYYATGEKEKELDIIGFVGFILTVFTLLFAAVIATFSLHPQWLIKNITTNVNLNVAKELLFILALFSPNMLIQRMLQLIYGIRVQDYILQQILLVVNSLKIAAVYFFYSAAHFNIIGYFLFSQVIACVGLLCGAIYAFKKYSIPVKAFFSRIKFSKPVFVSIKSLAFSSLYVTIAWLLFYEFDPYAIAKLSGAEAVAFYSVGLTCLGFFRSIYGALFNPFNARFNHFIAVKNFEGLADFTKTVMCILLPFVVFPTITLSLLSKSFVYTWLGNNFQESSKIVSLLALCNILAFITYPGSILSMATKRVRLLYVISTIQIIVYWGGISIFFSSYGYIVFAYFELTCFLLTGFLYIFFLCRFLKMDGLTFAKTIIGPAVIPVISLAVILFFSRNLLPYEKGKFNLMLVGITAFASISMALLIYYFTSVQFRNYTSIQILKLFRRFKFQMIKR